MTQIKRYQSRLRESMEVTENWILQNQNLAKMKQIEDDMYQTLKDGKSIYFFGNGGSAAESSHLAAEFVGKCLIDTGPQSAYSLNDSLSIVTAISNDWDYEKIFERQVMAHCRAGDLVIGLSTSGSANVIRGLEMAKNQGSRTWLFTCEKFEALSFYRENVLVANTKVTSIAQELHLQIGHAIIESLEVRMKA